MLSIARRNPHIEWHLGSATELPFEADSFDVVLCSKGFNTFPDRAAAMREMARVLGRGGRLALNVWGALERQPLMMALVNSVATFLAAEDRSAFDLAFSLNSREELRRLRGRCWSAKHLRPLRASHAALSDPGRFDRPLHGRDTGHCKIPRVV